MAKSSTKETTQENAKQNTKRTVLRQNDVPSKSLEKSLKIAEAIVNNYASKPATPLQVAKAMDVSPTTGPFRMLCGASVAYGLTIGGYNVEEISLQPIALRILKPKEEGDDIKAKVSAFLTPKVIKEFMEKYNGSPIPQESIAKNVLESMGVPPDKTDFVLNLIIEDGTKLGLISELKGKKYVELPKNADDFKKVIATASSKDNGLDEFIEENLHGSEKTQDSVSTCSKNIEESSNGSSPIKSTQNDMRTKKVFITHGKNRNFIEPIKKLLKFGEMEAVVSVEITSVSVPVPEKVMNDMRSCGAAIIHVEGEMTLIDKDANEHNIINSNVLIEIGAAMALFGKRFILLVKQGAKLPSNLQGLFEVRYSGDTLDGDATIRLLEAINDIKNQKLPD